MSSNVHLGRLSSWGLALALGIGLIQGCQSTEQARTADTTPTFDPAPPTVRPVDQPMPEPKGSHLTLVENGTPKATIIVMAAALTAKPDAPGNADKGIAAGKIAAAAKDLQDYVEKISGAKLPIVGDDQPAPEGTLILVGHSKATAPYDAKIPHGRTPEAAEEGYILVTHGKTLVLAGNDDLYYHGTEYAVDNFLYRQGVRWYMPGEFGEVIPKRPSIYAAHLDVLSRPDFKMRTWWGPQSEAARQLDYRWQIRNGMNPDTNNLIAMPGDSSVRNVVPPPDKITDKSMVDLFGKTQWGQPNPYMPNLSNPKSAAYAAEVVKKFFRANPQATSYGIAPDDGFPRDYTAETQKYAPNFPLVGGRTGILSEEGATEEWIRWIEWVRQDVAKEFPDKLISTNGYANRNAPPIGVTFDPRTPIMFAAIWCDTIHAFDNPLSWQMMRQGQMLEGWGKLSHNVFLYNYTYYMLASAGAAIPLSRKHAHDMPLYKKWGMVGFANEGRYVAGEQGIFPPYYQARLEWDSSLDRDTLAKEYFANWYGPAAEPARAFWEALENALETTKMLGHEDRVLPYVYTPQLLDELEGHIKAAEAMATDPWSKPRIHADRLILEHLKGFMNMHKAEFAADFPEAVRWANYMIEQRKQLNAISHRYFDINPATGESMGFYYWGLIARRDYYREMADKTTGLKGNMVAVLPEDAKFKTDPRDDGRFDGWYNPTFDDKAWQTIPTTAPFYIQGYRDSQGFPYMGAMWYRLNVDVPASAKGKKVILYAPAVESEAWVWVNGQFIGHREYHEAYERPNPIDMDVTAALRPGHKNSVVIRVDTALNAAAQAGGMTSRLFLYAPKPVPPAPVTPAGGAH